MISLIVATINRSTELERLLISLELQSHNQFEVIVVDQNQDDRVERVLRAHPGLTYKHLHSLPGLSVARNVGLRVAVDEIIAIPDDDCWYPEGLLKSVDAWFSVNHSFDLLSMTVTTADGSVIGPRWPKHSCEATHRNLFNCSISTAIFINRRVCSNVGLFDENLGVGNKTTYQSGEETDYLLRAFRLGYRMWFERSLTVHHPRLDDPVRLIKTSYSFALGSGYVLRKHQYSLCAVLVYIVRSFGGAVFSLCKGDLSKARAYILRGSGQVVGYICGPHAHMGVGDTSTLKGQ